MEEEKKAGHGADVHVPSDTEQFDAAAAAASPGGLSEREMRITKVSRRVAALATFYFANETKGLGVLALLTEIHCQTQFNFAAISALSMILKDKIGIDLDQLLEDTVKGVEDKLSEAETGFGIIIHPDKVELMQQGQSS